MKERNKKTFCCTKCGYTFLGVESFHGEYTLPRGGVKEVDLCSKCLDETQATWNGEPDTLRQKMEREIELCTMEHGIDKFAGIKRTAYENVLSILDHSITFNGHNDHGAYRGDLSGLELLARRIIHDDFKINFEEQVQLINRYVVDGYIKGKKPLILEFDSYYYHHTPEQIEFDNQRDLILTNRGYRVLRIPQRVIENENERSGLKDLLLDGLYDIKRSNKKSVVLTQLPVTPTST